MGVVYVVAAGGSMGYSSGMNEKDFEGTIVLEKLAEAGTVDAFFDAVDDDNFKTAGLLMRQAGIDAETIKTVMKKMADADGKH